MAESVEGLHFDGRSARGTPVRIAISEGVASLSGAGVAYTIPIVQLQVSEALGHAPRLIRLPDGAHCEVRDVKGLALLLAAGGYRAPRVERMQASFSWMLVALVVTLITFAAAYRWGVPWIAAKIADRVPQSVAKSVSENVMKTLDERLMKPSRLGEDRHQAIRDAFAAFRLPREVPYEIVFRSSPMGANAFALPSGLVIVTDELVKLAANDEETAAVLAHELGHVARRHGMRQIVQASIVGAVFAWWLGDVSSVVTAAPALLLEAKYSREFEQEADDYAAALLRASGRSPELLASMLERLGTAPSHDDEDSAAGEGKAPAPTTNKSERRPTIFDYLSSHPATEARVARLRAGG